MEDDFWFVRFEHRKANFELFSLRNHNPKSALPDVDNYLNSRYVSVVYGMGATFTVPKYRMCL